MSNVLIAPEVFGPVGSERIVERDGVKVVEKVAKGMDGSVRVTTHELGEDVQTPAPRLAPLTKEEKAAARKAKKTKVVVTDTIDAGGGILVDVVEQKPTKKAKKIVVKDRNEDEPKSSGDKKVVCSHGSKSHEGIVWEISDKYSDACATRISDPFTGESTGFAMVHGWDGAAEKWHSIRPVSDRYKPIRTQDLIEIAVERLQGNPLMPEKLRTDRFGTSLEIKIPINRPIEIGKGKAFDQGHPWTRHGEQTSRDSLFPVVSIRNSYDATSGIIVDVGLFRMICSNGMKIMLAGVGARAIHTKHEVARVIETIAKQELTGDLDFVQKLSTTKLDTKDVAKIMGDRVPEKWQKELAAYAKLGNNSAWAWMNGLSYLSTHEYSLLRSRQLDPIMTGIQKLAA